MPDRTKSKFKRTRSPVGTPVRTTGELALRLAAEHQKANGCWYTRYDRIVGLEVLASDTNGTSGIGRVRGIGEVFWSRDHRTGEFHVERGV